MKVRGLLFCRPIGILGHSHSFCWVIAGGRSSRPTTL